MMFNVKIQLKKLKKKENTDSTEKYKESSGEIPLSE